MKTIRIFVSSPGDFQEERDRARDVVHQLRRKYAGRLDLSALLWEELPLSADMSFQQGIDLILSEAGVDIAVFILWSRLGSPTGTLMTDETGRPYRSGTEREWDLMLRARQRCVQEGSVPRPSIIVYTRQDDVSFEERLRSKPDEVKAQEIEQKLLVKQFIEEEFRDAETGVNIRAYHSFDQPTTFARQLRIHLSNMLDPLAGDDTGPPVWSVADQGPPFRGLDVFEYHHAPIFFGREDEIVTIRTRLREQACRGCAFVLISGPSGSGKSSLARAGVLPDVCNYEVDADIRQWRSLAIRPSQLGDYLLAGIVKSITAEDVLPELNEWADDIVTPKEPAFIREWSTRFGLRVGDALKIAGGKRRATRLILLVDQMEELFSDAAISDESRQQLFDALEVLARSGSVWVLATVRSDFYHHCQTLPALVRMKEGAGQFDLVPPTPDALSRVITGPALLAGLRFEREGEQSLSDTILREAAEHKELLPLAEHLLLELYQHRTDDGMLTFAEFRRRGGVAGALRDRCEETSGKLSPPAQASLDAALSELVTLSGDSLETFVRRSVPIEHFDGHTAQRELVDAMVAARLFTTSSGSDGASVVSVAHEALLRVWPRVTEWIALNREHLRLRARVEQSQQRWEQQEQDNSLLLASGLPLREGRQLLVEASHLLSPATRSYIEASIRFHDQRSRRRKIIAAISLVLLVLGGWYAWEARGRLRAEGVVQAIYGAKPEELPRLIDGDLPHLRRWADPLLYDTASDRTQKNGRAQLHARLALLPTDSSQVEPLRSAFVAEDEPYYVDLIQQRLRPYAAQISTALWNLLHDASASKDQRFRAGLALAGYAPNAPEWTPGDAQFVVEQLLSSNLVHQPTYWKLLAPVRTQLLPPLRVAFAAGSRGESQQIAAANAIAQFAADQPEVLAERLVEATPEQYKILYPIVESQRTPAIIEKLAAITATLPDESMKPKARVPDGQQRANAAVTLLRLGQREKVFPVFEIADDPEALTQFIFRCRPRGVGADALLDCLQMVSAAPNDRYPQHTRYALLLALGEFTLQEIPEARRDPLLRQLADWYAKDPSSGVHGAAGWLLRHWGQSEVASKIDQTPMPYSADREWFTLAIDVEAKSNSLLGGLLGASTKKTFYYTFIVFPAEVSTIGSVADQPDRQKDEVRHQVKLTRPFALLDREVSLEELIAFSPAYSEFMRQFDARPEDAGFGVHWYDAVGFCRWLGKQSRLPESDQPYASPESLDREKYPREPNPEASWAPRDWPVDLSRRGFRLPTEAEWEIAARAGVRASYGFGSEVNLLGHFGWYAENSGKHVHPPRGLRPSVRGLFDLHGNLYEWTHDWYAGFGSEAVTDPLGPPTGSLRVGRGGGWGNGAADCRSAYRFTLVPSIRAYDSGFRLALSLSGVSSAAEQVPEVAEPVGGGTEERSGAATTVP